MTRAQLRWAVIGVIFVYAGTIVVGILWRQPLSQPASQKYGLYKDLMPLVIAIPAAYLAFAFQRRNSYLQALRSVWSKLADAIASAITYTNIDAPTEQRYVEVLTKLGAAIEEIRGVFRNIRSLGWAKGLYPFEPIKQIYLEFRELGFGADATPARRGEVRARIDDMWKQSRLRLLAEFDRGKPARHYTEHLARTVKPKAPSAT